MLPLGARNWDMIYPNLPKPNTLAYFASAAVTEKKLYSHYASTLLQNELS